MLRRTLLSLSLIFAFSCGSGSPSAPQASSPAQTSNEAPALRGGASMQPPVQTAQPAATPQELAQQKHGAELYARICAVCHGQKGEGYKADRANALAHPEFLASVSDSFLRIAIARGRAGTVMSAWSTEHGGPLTSSDIDALVAFLRTWQTKPRTPLDERPLHGDAARAEPVYAKECAQCHGARGVRGPNIQVGDPALLGSVSNGFLRHAIRDGRGGTPMPAFAAKLGDQGVEDMVALLRSFALPPAPPAGQAAGVDPHADHAHLHEPPKLTAPLPLGKVPLNPRGKEPVGFEVYPKTTSAKVIHEQLTKGARMAILDARPPSDYVREHITGAVSVPYYDPSPYLDKLPKDVWMVCYCACPSAESGELCTKLQKAGFEKVTVLAEGLGFWQSQKWKTTKAKPEPATKPKK